MTEDAAKRELTQLLKDFNDNIGTAGFICGRPVELLPAPERDRIVKGFCSETNVQVFRNSLKPLEAASRYAFPEPELKRINDARVQLARFIPMLNAFVSSEISFSQFQVKVRELLHKPIPQGEDACINEMARLCGIVEFLAGEPLEKKDRWDQIIDCAQMHDVLTRTLEVSGALKSASGENSEITKKLTQTVELSKGQLAEVESFFLGDKAPKALAQQFKLLASELKNLWGSKLSG